MKKHSVFPLKIRGFQNDIIEREFSSLNVVSDKAGWVGTRPALTTIKSQQGGDTGVFGMTSFKNKLIVHCGTRVYQETSQIWSGSQPIEKCHFAEVNDTLFYNPQGATSGNPVQVYDGTTNRDTTAKTSASTLLTCGALCAHRGILWAGDTLEDDGAHPNRLRWSAFAEPENFEPWGTGNYQNYEDIGSVSDPIVKMVSFKNNLIIFKERSVWVAGGVNGINVGPEEIIQVLSNTGIVGANAVAVTDEMVFFISEEGVLGSHDGINWKPVFEEIVPMIETRKREYWQYSIITVNSVTDTVYIGVPVYGPYCEDLLVRSPDGNWWRHTYPNKITCLATTFWSANSIYTYMGDELGTVCYVDSGSSKDFGTTEISSKFGLDWQSGGTHRTKNMRTLQFTARVEGEFNVTINMFHDGDLTAYASDTVSLEELQPILDTMRLDTDTIAQKNIHIPHFIDLDGHCKIFRFDFTSTKKFKIRDIIVGAVIRGSI